MPSVLIIDDDGSVHKSLGSHLDGLVDEILHARTPEEGLRLATSRLPSLILLDINMPRMDGLKVCRHLKESALTRDIPVLFLTIDRNVQHLAKALECGGTDYIMKPFNPVELKARVAAALRSKQFIELLREQARIDALTGIGNRAAMDEALNSAVSLVDRSGQPMSLVIVDIDHFKAVNDGFGHGVGDDILRGVGAVIRNCFRPSDTACRFGGDEFGVILVDTGREGAVVATERLLSSIRELRLSTEKGEVRITCSAGLACVDELPRHFRAGDVLKAADDALYAAKQAGRDRLVVSE